jgi:hypothetical protein
MHACRVAWFPIAKGFFNRWIPQAFAVHAACCFVIAIASKGFPICGAALDHDAKKVDATFLKNIMRKFERDRIAEDLCYELIRQAEGQRP